MRYIDASFVLYLYTRNLIHFFGKGSLLWNINMRPKNQQENGAEESENFFFSLHNPNVHFVLFYFISECISAK